MGGCDLEGLGDFEGFGEFGVWRTPQPCPQFLPLGSMAVLPGPEFLRDAKPGGPRMEEGQRKKWDKNGK